MSETSDHDEHGDLGPQPDPVIEPGEPNPGGVDAVPEEGLAVPVDLLPESNPASAGDAQPDELSEREDTSTEATRSDGDEAVDPEDEPPV